MSEPESRGTALARRARRVECQKLGHIPFDPLPDDVTPPPEGWNVCGRCYQTYRYALDETGRPNNTTKG